MRYALPLMSGFAIVAALGLWGCQDAILDEPDADTLPIPNEQINTAESNTSDPEREAFDVLYGHIQSNLPIYVLMALDGKWSFEDVARSTTAYQDHAPKAVNCADPETPVFTVPEGTSLEIRFSSLQSTTELKQGFRKSCFAEWGVVFDFVPGMMGAQHLETGPARQVCGVCQDVEGQTIAGTAMIFDVVETTE